MEDKIQNPTRRIDKKYQIAIMKLTASAFDQIGAMEPRFDLLLETNFKMDKIYEER